MNGGATQQWGRVRRALVTAASEWLYDPNVTLIDYGYRETDGTLMTGEAPRIRVHVRRKIPQGPAFEAAVAEGLTHGAIPDDIGGIPVDRPQGAYQPKLIRSPSTWRSPQRAPRRDPRRDRVDPLRAGVSVSDAYRSIAGTIGSSVLDRRTGKPMIVSNWHVLSGVYGRRGWPILQPGRGDGGGHRDRVGTLARDAMSSNLDAAVAWLDDQGRRTVNEPLGLGSLRGVGLAQLGMGVAKSGRTTGVSRGVVTGVEGVQLMRYMGVGGRRISHVFTVSPGDEQLSLPGDSGAMWIDERTMDAVGLHFAGNRADQPERALAMDISAVLDALEVDLDA